MRIALGQINSTVGDLAGNLDRMIGFAEKAAARNAELIVFPELSITGYPPRDLVERASFVDRSEAAVDELADRTRELPLAIVAGYVGRSHRSTGKRATNSAAVIRAGEILLRQSKILLPTYDVFDEGRNFVAAESQSIWNAELSGGVTRVALAICEDAWNDREFWPHLLYRRDPVDELMHKGAEMIVSINASPFYVGKRAIREEMFRAMTRRHNAPAIVVNLVGGNDQIVFDGSSFAMDAEGNVIASAASFSEDLVLVDTATGEGEQRAGVFRRMRSCLRSACSRNARLHSQMRLPQGADRAERRHRFFAHGGHSGRRRRT